MLLIYLRTRARKRRTQPDQGSAMKLSRRSVLKSIAATGAAATSPGVFAPAIAQAKPVRIGILAPRTGIAASPGISGLRGHRVGGRALQCRRRHRRAQDRAGGRGGDHRPRTPSSASRSSCSRTRSTACRASSRRASPRAGPGGRGGARAHHLLGRHHAGRRGGEAAQPAVPLPQHRQRVRGGDVLAARPSSTGRASSSASPASTRTTPTAATTWRPSWRC